jgi:hypothetical protein
MSKFAEWVKQTHKVDLDEMTSDLREPVELDGEEQEEAATVSGPAAGGPTDSGDVARYNRPILGGEKVKRMAVDPILVDVDGKPKKDKNKVKTPKGVRPMKNDIPDLE